LIRRQKNNAGALIEISLMGSLLDFQFELLTTYYTNHQQPQRSKVNNGHPLLSAPYGIYQTEDGYIALAMMDIKVLANAIQCPALERFPQEQAFVQRDNIKKILADHMITQQTGHWLARLQQQDLWAMEVLDWEQMLQHEAYKVLQMEQLIHVKEKQWVTTRCPIRIDGERLYAAKAAPQLGADNEKIKRDFLIV
jgi:crotonobetainyl-CoA:carnitine CoA-transferase CaiB-like acyl-CoA transferase